MRRPSFTSILITLTAGAAGALLQSSASGGFAEMSPSRIATLPVAILLGPWHGIVAVLLAALSGGASHSSSCFASSKPSSSEPLLVEDIRRCSSEE